jgi:hypothetical protein
LLPWQLAVQVRVVAFQVRTPVPVAVVTMFFFPSMWVATAAPVTLELVYPAPWHVEQAVDECAEGELWRLDFVEWQDVQEVVVVPTQLLERAMRAPPDEVGKLEWQ